MDRNDKLEILKSFRYTHRGYHDKPAVPENSIAAFLRTKEHGWGSEMDIHLMKDGNLAIAHDSNLKRVTGEDVLVEDLTAEELKKLRLEGTDEKVPLFEELLELKIPLIVELKVANGNYAELAAASWERLKNYDAPFCIESFDPRAVYWYTKNQPQIIRGQLAQDYSNEAQVHVSGLMKTMLRDLWFNPITKPDFVAYRFSDRENKYLQRYLRKGGQEVSWTIRTKEDFDTAVRDGSIPIFELFDPEK